MVKKSTGQDEPNTPSTGTATVRVLQDGVWSSDGRMDKKGGPTENGVYLVTDTDALLLAERGFVEILED